MLWLLLACGGPRPDDTHCEPRIWYADADRDSHGSLVDTTLACEAPTDHLPEGDDCDDQRGDVFPGAAESCNGIDDDCDGTADEDLVAYLDSDKDGFGHDVVACTMGVSSSTDCNDADGDVHPWADEHCDGVDEDCDDVVDDAPVDGFNWYPDADGDGWGSDPAVARQCEPIAGHVTRGGDCNDSDAGTSPEATEICDNGLDEDCSANCFVDGEWEASNARVRILGDDSSTQLNYAGPLVGSGGRGLFVTTQNPAPDSPGLTWLFQSVPPTQAYVSEADAVLTSPAETWYVRHYDDVDGDGAGELIFEARVALVEPAIYIVSADTTGGALTDEASIVLTTRSEGARYLWASESAADVGADGVSDLVVSDATSTAWIVPTSRSADVEDLATTTITSDWVNDTSLGDLDGDGNPDAVLGAESEDDGVVYLFYDPAPGALTTDDADVRLAGTVTGIYMFGFSSDVVDDLDGDGIHDLTVASPVGHEIWSAPILGGVNTSRATLSEYHAGPFDVGDLDGDAHADVVWRNPGWETSLIYGPLADGTHTDGNAVFESYYMYQMAFLGDVDGDGREELALTDGIDGVAGVSYLFFGSAGD